MAEKNETNYLTALKVYTAFPGQMLLMLGFFLIATIPFWSTPILIARLIDTVSLPPDRRLHLFIVYTSLMAGLILQNFPTAVFFHKYMSYVARNTGRRLRLAVCTKLQQLSILFHKKNSIGRLQAKAIREIEIIEKFPTIFMHNIFSVLIILTVAVLTAALRAPQTLLFFCGLLVLSVSLSIFFSKKLNRNIHRYRYSYENMSSRLSDMLTMIPITRAHGLKEHELNVVNEKIDQVAAKGQRFDLLGGIFMAGGYVTISIAYVIFVSGSVWLCYRQMITIGDVVMFSNFFARLSGGISNLLRTIPEFSQLKESLNSVNEILNEKDTETYHGRNFPSVFHGNFTFSNVSFIYPKTNSGLKNININVPAGKAAAFFGSSGCGKSTMLSLIMGFIKPQQGKITIDNINFNEIDVKKYRSHIGVVAQENVFFSGTIKENITYGQKKTDTVKLNQVLHHSQAMDFIGQLPRGINTHIGAGGFSLSGGQQQRLAIARALYRDPAVLIFDEATSALDVQTEKAVQNNITELIRTRTAFIVSHRFFILKNVAKIFLLENGFITAAGSHNELLQYDNQYSRFYKMQRAV
ncbi:MAG TPA: ABC transporter ATP-binding protein [Spirochaetota bacterium]|nr:ABC transporter ATP-binding protein [Spirochaetota bacterium]